ncbi:unnamed protein product [Miscanthus lutarioriparius]|uniref:Uncharacterized protein n=1 Tax=Miscanthus lutarioriparius TaxID=422564 RepID=A0A811RYA2_9POAL|nr:unnamed protein product [Miscanthus lutarioriparius]
MGILLRVRMLRLVTCFLRAEEQPANAFTKALRRTAWFGTLTKAPFVRSAMRALCREEEGKKRVRALSAVRRQRHLPGHCMVSAAALSRINAGDEVKAENRGGVRRRRGRIFPKATRFKRDELLNMWIAEGLVNANADEDLEDKEDNGMFHMHDLIHELAGRASGSDCFRFEEGDPKRKTPPGNTRYLYVDLYDPMEVLEGIGKLALLRTLGHFNVKKEKGYELQQLGSLNHLHASLEISGLENVKSKAAALQAKLVDKKYLTEVSLVWTEHHSCPLGLQAELSEDQQRLRNLQRLKLELCLKLEALPEIRELVHLHELILRSLPKLKSLPILPQNLKTLQISDCEALLLTCAEDVEFLKLMFDQTRQTVPSLNITDSGEMYRIADEEPITFRELMRNISDSFGGRRHQYVHPGMVSRAVPFICGQTNDDDYCKVLLPFSLEDLSISGCIVTDTVVNNWIKGSSGLVRLELGCIPFFTKISCDAISVLSKLRMLSIGNCFHFTSIEGISEFTRETLDFTIVGCPNISSLGDDEKIRVVGSICIDGLSVVKKLFSREACARHYFLQILCSEKLGDEEVLLQFDSLLTLWFEDCSIDMLPSNLECLTSMCCLVLNGCKNIQSLPTLPAKLQYFVACDCHERFVETCKKKDHPNWRNIEHVPDVILRTDALPLNTITSLVLQDL